MDKKEEGRLKSLHRYNLLDTPPDGTFDKLTKLAASIFNIPIALITLVDTDRIWFKSKYGLETDQISRDPGLCASAILSDDVYVVEDARNDPRTLANPLVASSFGLQFYAAAPLHTKDGYNLGTFCILDKQKRYFNTRQQEDLKLFSEIVMDIIEQRLQAHNALNELQSKIDNSSRSKIA
jgi:GAF domain-containing protein